MILSCGEALIDMLPRTSGTGENCFAPHPGGAVFNTAIALGRLGAPSAFFSGLSSDMFGDLLRQTLIDSGVDCSSVHIADRPTTLAFVQLNDGQAQYAFYDENTAGRLLTPNDIPSVTADCLFFGGISLAAEPCADAYEALQQREAATKTIMIDPNIRAGFIQDETCYRQRINRMIDRSDIVKLSDDDLLWICGPGTLAAHAKPLLARGPKLIFITEGAKGATGYSKSETIFVPASPVKVVDTVGAGDTFNAGLLAALYQHNSLGKDQLTQLSAATITAALNFASRAAAITVSRAGANAPWKHEL